MKKALILNTGYAYYQRFVDIANYLESNGFTVEWSNNGEFKCKSYDFLLANSLQFLSHILNSQDIVAHSLCIPAIYEPNNCPINDLNNIETITSAKLDSLLKIFKFIVFLSEHDEAHSLLVYTHLRRENTKILTWRWGLTNSDKDQIKNFSINYKDPTFYFYIGTLLEKKERIVRLCSDLLSTSLSVHIIHPDSTKLCPSNQLISSLKFIHPDKYTSSIIKLVRNGGMPLNIHHEFEILSKSTYNERAIKLYALGIPHLSDAPFRLMREFGMLTSLIGSIEMRHKLYLCIPPKLADNELDFLLNQNLNKNCLDQLCAAFQ